MTSPTDPAGGVKSPASTFWGDLAKAARACAAAPMLPVVSVVLVLPAEASQLFPAESQLGVREAMEWLGVAFGVFGVGWLGTQRIWYQRLFAGGTLSPSDVWRLSWRFFGRFFVLGLSVGLPGSVAIVWLIAQLAMHQRSPGDGPPGWWLPFWLAYTFLVDIVLTFVTPALAYTTNSVRTAITIGLNMIRVRWPDSVPYAIAPAVALLALATFIPSAPVWRIVLVVISTLIGLVLKGAIAAFYLRASADTRYNTTINHERAGRTSKRRLVRQTVRVLAHDRLLYDALLRQRLRIEPDLLMTRQRA